MASITFGEGPKGFSLVFSFTRLAIFGCSPGTYGCNSLTSGLQYLLIFLELQNGAGAPKAAGISQSLIRYSAERAWAVRPSPRANTEATRPMRSAPSGV